MAKKHNTALELSDIQEALLQIAARRAGESDALGAEVLRLAAAISNAVVLSAPPNESRSDNAPPAPAALVLWRDACAELLAALAPAVDGGRGHLGGHQPSTRYDSLPARAMELVSQTRTASDELRRACQSLREQVAGLLREASHHGALERELQLKRSAIADLSNRAKAAEAALAALDSENGQILCRIEDLQNRFRLAGQTPEQIARFEQEVKVAEARHQNLSDHLKSLQDTLRNLELQNRALPERIEKTESLIRDLRESPERALVEQIDEIWRRLKRFHEGRE